MATPPRTEEALRRVVSAVAVHGSRAKAAASLGMDWNTVDRHLKEAKARGIGNPPKPVAPAPPPPPSKPKVYACRPAGSKLKVLGVGDVHFDPNISSDPAYYIGRLAADEAVDAIEQIGDLANNNSLCRHIPDETYHGRLKGTFLDDMAAVNRGLDRIDEGLGNHRCRKHVTLGNHDDRIWSAADRAPHTWGMMEAEFTNVLDRHGWTWTRFGEIHYLGGVGFTHVPLNVMGRPYGGKTVENQIGNDTTHDLVFGHTHRHQVRRVPKIGPFRHITVVNLGCALPFGHIEEYAKHSMTGWSWGVCMLTIQGGQITETKFTSMAELEEKYG